MNIIDRIKSRCKVNEETGCWEYQRALNKKGYGVVSLTVHGKKYFLVHRAMWAAQNGPIPDGKTVCHSCDVRNCANPDHLWMGTQADNIADMDAKGRRKTPCGERNGRHTHPESTVRGEKSGVAKLTNENVLEIRRLYHAGMSGRELAIRFGIVQGYITQIVTRKSWAHLDNEQEGLPRRRANLMNQLNAKGYSLRPGGRYRVQFTVNGKLTYWHFRSEQEAIAKATELKQKLRERENV